MGEDIHASEPYHYRSCGLDGIYLLNGFDTKVHDGEEHVSIKDIDGLHMAIGRYLVMHRKALAPEEIRFLRRTMDLSQAELGEAVGKTNQSVARWEKGESGIPATAEKLLRAIFIARLPDDDALDALRDFLAARLEELDTFDEVADRPVQFELAGAWKELEAA